MRSLSSASVAMVVGLGGLCGCGTLLGIDGLVADRDGGTAASGAGGGCSGPCGTEGCAACPDESVVVVMSPMGPYSIDRYEVTNAQYDAFLASNPSLSLAPQPECAWNDSYEPGAITAAADAESVAAGQDPYDPTGCNELLKTATADDPVICVDWCDAAAYCAWTKKRLCGLFGGKGYDTTDMDQKLAPGDPIDASIGSESEWQAACAGPAGNAYPYGPTPLPMVCNDKMSGPKPVGSLEKCEGGYDGLFDMSGNVEEWENGCTDYGSPPELQNCTRRGGNWFQSEKELRCDSYHGIARFGLSDGAGIRCCSDGGG